MVDETDINVNIGSNPTGIEQGSRRASAAVQGVAKTTRDLDDTFRKLKAAIDPTFAAQDRYNKAMAESRALVDAGRISQKEYSEAVALAKRILDSQLSSIQRNSSAAKAAAAEAKASALAEAVAKQQVAQSAAEAAAATVAAERKKFNELKTQISLNRALETAAIHEVAEAAKAAAQARIAAERQAAEAVGKKGPTRAQERAVTAQSVAAAVAAAKEIAAASKLSDDEQVASSRQRIITLKADAADLAATAAALAKERSLAETAAARATEEVEVATQREVKKAIQDSAVVAAATAKERKRLAAEEREAATLAARAVQEQARAAKADAQAVEQLRSSVDPAFAAQTRYNATMAEATRLLFANKLAAGEWVAVQKQAKAQMDLNVRSLGRMNNVYVQMGYQTQDVVASLASGINPLVILAQQGGQTAAALSQLGGTVGRVASFFAGPWGAAIIGATLLLGMFIDNNKKAKDTALDLADAEAIRTAKLDKLTDALKKFNEQQERANNLQLEEHHQIAIQAANANAEAQNRLARALNAVNRAKEGMRIARSITPIEGEDPVAVAQAVLDKANQELADAQKAAMQGTTAVTEASITRAVDAAEAASDQMKKIDQDYQRVYQAILADRRKGIITEEESIKRLTQAMLDRNKAEKAYRDSQRQQHTRPDRGLDEVTRFDMPIPGQPSSGFGPRLAPHGPRGPGSTFHPAIDIPAVVGTPVHAPAPGVVKDYGYNPELGKWVLLVHGGGTETRYGHLSDNSGLIRGQQLERGQVFARTGNTGNSTGPHLDYQVTVNGKAVDPRKGIFPIDRIDASANVAEQELKRYLAGLDTEQEAAGEDYKKILEIQDKKIAALAAYYGVTSTQVEEATKKRVELERKQQEQITRETIKGIQTREAKAVAAERQRDDLAQTNTGIKSDTIDYQSQYGLISERAALEAHRQILEEEYAEQVAHEERMYQIHRQSIVDQLKVDNLPLQQKIELNARLEEEEAAHQERMAQLQNQQARQAHATQLQFAGQTMAKWGQVVDTFTQGLGQAFQGLWTHSVSIQQALINIADQLVYKFADMGLKILHDWIMRQVQKRAVTAASTATETAIVTTGAVAQAGAVAAGQAAQTGATVAGTATRKGVIFIAAIKQIGADAYQAAAGVFRSVMTALPFPINVAVAPAAAAATFGAVLAFGSGISAAGGWGEVPADGVQATLHKKEMVMPAVFAEPLRKWLVNRDSAGLIGNTSAAGNDARSSVSNGGDSYHFDYNPRHNNMGASLETLLRQDGSTLRRWLKNEVRDGRLKFKNA